MTKFLDFGPQCLSCLKFPNWVTRSLSFCANSRSFFSIGTITPLFWSILGNLFKILLQVFHSFITICLFCNLKKKVRVYRIHGSSALVHYNELYSPLGHVLVLCPHSDALSSPAFRLYGHHGSPTYANGCRMRRQLVGLPSKF
jgi:hypothetical protein